MIVNGDMLFYRRHCMIMKQILIRRPNLDRKNRIINSAQKWIWVGQ